MSEPAIDLGIVMALASSFQDRPVDEKTICFGEVGLSGEVRAVNMAQQRVAEARKTGLYHLCPAQGVHSRTYRYKGNQNHWRRKYPGSHPAANFIKCGR